MSRLARRAGEGALVLLAVSFLSFVLADLAPGDFFSEMRLDPRLSPSAYRAQRARYGLDQPLPVRYARWISSVARGELGYSFAYGSPVAPLLAPRLANTLLLTLSATAVAWLVALPLGVFWAATRHPLPRHALAAAMASLLAIPDILLALGLLLLALRTGWLPPGGMTSVGHERMSALPRMGDVARHLALPGAALVLCILPGLTRHVRSSMAAALDAPFVRAARAHGLSPARVLFAHALPAAANPLVSLLGLSLASLLSMSLLVEVVTSWPGLGPLLLEAILARDLHVVLGTVLAAAVLLLAANAGADVLLLAADPRIRRGPR